jgi:catabolite regulation protein CreA
LNGNITYLPESKNPVINKETNDVADSANERIACTTKGGVDFADTYKRGSGLLIK